VRRREPGRDRGQHVPLRRRVVPGHETDQRRDAGERALAGRREETFGGKSLLEPLERGEVRAEAEALDRERAQPELAACLEEGRAPVDVDAFAVDEVQAQGVELAARHLDGEACAALGILQREEDGGPRGLTPELGHLALDPDRRQPLEPRRDALVEGRDGVDLAIAVLERLDLAHALRA
jgi:hypothetical protein